MLAEQLKQKLVYCEKLGRLAARAHDQAASAGVSAAAMTPILTRLIANTKQLQLNVSFLVALGLK